MCTVILHPFNVKWLEWRLMTINIDPTCENVILEKCFRPRLMWQLVPDGKFQTRLSILWWMLWETCFQWIHLIYRMISTFYIYHQDSELFKLNLSLSFVGYWQTYRAVLFQIKVVLCSDPFCKYYWKRFPRQTRHTLLQCVKRIDV